MERVYDVAQYIFDEYKRVSGQTIDKMKLHKLLYFTQRESLAILGEPMFETVFEGWKYGPVCRDISQAYSPNGIRLSCANISSENAYIVRNIIEGYGSIASWKLSQISHREISWINSRKGLSHDDNGNVPMKLSDIREDASKIRPYDYMFDMYYDEFEDAV